MATVINPISATVDFDADGIQHGHLVLPHSSNVSAWGSIMIPVCVAGNGDGPTVLMTGGNHGDEYEGPVALMDFALSLDPGTIQGRVIIIPALNYPAFCAGQRNSPLDGGNMNRSFPGRPDGGPTEKIAHFVTSQLLPRADLVLDIHSGGRTLDFIPFAACHRRTDHDMEAHNIEAMMAFRAPNGLVLLELDAVGMLDTEVEEMGKLFISTELGGGGTSSPRTVRIAQRGIRNILRYLDMMDGEPEGEESRTLDMPDGRCYVISQLTGLVEWHAELGEAVEEGQPIAFVHDINHTGRVPTAHYAGISGILTGKRFPGLTNFGDTLAVIGVPAD